ncbi:MAG: hypothetical protein JNM94_18010 [Phycisphaerae bacterium]|nr:hypothetical protein [Phycisphaerae bacterium]
MLGRHTLLSISLAVGGMTSSTHPLLAETRSVGELAPPVVDSTVVYHRMVIPQVTAEEWLDAWRQLGIAGDQNTQAAESAIKAYAERISGICEDFGKFAAERELRECLSGTRVENPGSEEAVQDCFGRLRNRAWPQADAAIDQTWEALTAGIDPKDAEKIARAHRVKLALLRLVIQREISSPASWSYGGEGLDLRSVVRRAAADDDVSDGLRNGLKRSCGEEGADAGDPPAEVQAAASAIRASLMAFEDLQSSAIVAYFKVYREGAVARPARGEDPRVAAEARFLKRSKAVQEVRANLFRAINEVTEAIRLNLGEVAAAEWEDRALAAALPEAFQEELPTALHRWLRSHELLGPQCEERYVEYLKARAPMRARMVELVLAAKRENPRPPKSGNSIDSLVRMRNERSELSEATVRDMLSGLRPEDRVSAEAHLEALRKQWDPARSWRNM